LLVGAGAAGGRKGEEEEEEEEGGGEGAGRSSRGEKARKGRRRGVAGEGW